MDEHEENVAYMHNGIFSFSLKKGSLPFGTTWMHLEGVSQIKDDVCMISLICGI